MINIGISESSQTSKVIDNGIQELSLIKRQKPVFTYSKISISGNRLKERMPICTKATLRVKRMYDFLQKLVDVALPRVRDFRGISNKAFDGRGNYTLGIKEQLIFPEINYDDVGKIRGMDIS